MEFNIIITRHAGLVKYLKEEGIVGDAIEVSSHASPELVKGKHVIGVLPHSLSCLCRTFTEVPLNLTPEMRGKELSCADVRAIAGDLITYNVEKVEKVRKCPLWHPTGGECQEALAEGFCSQQCCE